MDAMRLRPYCIHPLPQTLRQRHASRTGDQQRRYLSTRYDAIRLLHLGDGHVHMRAADSSRIAMHQIHMSFGLEPDYGVWERAESGHEYKQQ